MYKIFVKILCGILGAVLSLVILNTDDRNTQAERVNLQCPSLVYASMSNRYSNMAVTPDDDDDEEERKAEEADSEKDSEAVGLNNPGDIDLNDYTIKVPVNYEEIANKVRGDDADDDNDQKNYDGKFVWTKTNAKVYASPDTTSKSIALLKKGTKAIRISVSGGWSYIRFSNGSKGYILTSCLSSKKVNLPTPTPKPKPKAVKHTTVNSNSKSKSSSTSKKSGGGSKRSGGFGSFVRGFVGCKYVPGGSSPRGFDCSGFTMYCYRAYYGIRLPHGSNMQSTYGRKVSLNSLKVGDIIYLDHDHNGKSDHVGIYVGGGQMVHASGVKYGVVCVSLKNVKDIMMARRIR